MKRVQKLVGQSAACDGPVLITGEVGVGKDLLAREIHERSSRCDKALLEINGASLSADFFESDLLSHEASALGTADRSTPSRLEALAGGTLFLDDIGELSPALQDSLLQRLRRGDARQIQSEPRRRVDFRLIVATRRELTEAMEAGAFSEDLYYRINLIHIHVPPLRTHPEDIPALLQHFMQEHGRREGEDETEIPENMLARFRSYDWPGNVRELENAVRRLIALRDPAYVLEELEAQFEKSPSRPPRANTDAGGQHVASAVQDDGRHSVDLKELGRKASDLAERVAILDMLRRTTGNKKEAAQRLGISYKAMLYKIHDFGIARSRTAPSDGNSADDASPTRV